MLILLAVYVLQLTWGCRLEVQAEKLKKRCQLQELPDIANPTTLREGAAAKVKLHRAALSAALNLAKERQFLDHLMKKYAGKLRLCNCPLRDSVIFVSC